MGGRFMPAFRVNLISADRARDKALAGQRRCQGLWRLGGRRLAALDSATTVVACSSLPATDGLRAEVGSDPPPKTRCAVRAPIRKSGQAPSSPARHLWWLGSPPRSGPDHPPGRPARTLAALPSRLPAPNSLVCHRKPWKSPIEYGADVSAPAMSNGGRQVWRQGGCGSTRLARVAATLAGCRHGPAF